MEHLLSIEEIMEIANRKYSQDRNRESILFKFHNKINNSILRESIKRAKKNIITYIKTKDYLYINYALYFVLYGLNKNDKFHKLLNLKSQLEGLYYEAYSEILMKKILEEDTYKIKKLKRSISKIFSQNFSGFGELNKIFTYNLEVINLRENTVNSNESIVSLYRNYLPYLKLKNNPLSLKVLNDIKIFFENYMKNKIKLLKAFTDSETDSIYFKIKIIEGTLEEEEISNVSLYYYETKLKELIKERDNIEKINEEIDDLNDVKILKSNYELLQRFNINKESTKLKEELKNKINKISDIQLNTLKTKIEKFENKNNSLVKEKKFFEELYKEIRDIKEKDMDFYILIENRYSFFKKKLELINSINQNFEIIKTKKNLYNFIKLNKIIDIYKNMEGSYEEELEIKNKIYNENSDYEYCYNNLLNLFEEALKNLEFKNFEEFELTLNYIKELVKIEEKERLNFLLEEVKDNIEKIKIQKEKYKNLDKKNHKEIKKLKNFPINFSIFFKEDKLEKEYLESIKSKL